MATINGNNANNTLNGTASADDIYGGGGQDTVNAGDGADTVFGGTGSDSLLGQGGDDSILGESGNDRLFGGTGNDSLDGGIGNDSLDGGTGNDLLQGGAGNDTIIGGTGTDTVDYSYAGTAATVNLTTGAGTTGGTDVDTISGVENVIGTGLADSITGNTANNQIDGGAGGDTITAGSGNDVVYGGDGDDNISAGTGSTTAVSEDLNWSAAGADEANVAGGVTQDTGNVVVQVTNTNDGNATEFSIESSSSVYIGGGETFSSTSNLYIAGTGAGDTSTTRVDFTPDSGFESGVRNVRFRINDIDMADGSWQDIITITAYDAAGNPVPVTFTISGNDSASGGTITAGNTSDSATSAAGSVLVSIPGPVAWFTIDYNNSFTSGQLIYVSDIQFTATPVDNDYVDGGAGNDTITGQTGNDTLLGGTGNDSLDGGADDDSLVGGTGNDTLVGGTGNDTLAGEDGADTLDGGAGNDSLLGGAGSDSLSGGDGNDTIYFGGDDDTVYGGSGDDVIDDVAGSSLAGANLIYGGLGNDTVWTGLGDDTILGDEGDDRLYGEDGNDSLQGGIGADVLDGGAGNDALLGGDGADSLFGGAGRDVLYGGAGADVVDGGADQDTIYGDLGDTVTGGSSGIDLDVLDLTAWGKALTNIYKDPLNPENGYVEFLDSFGAVIGTMQFSDIETIIPCFTPGTLIATDRGEVAVETLRPGDLVMTRDHGLQPIRWVGRKELSFAQLIAQPALRPVRIKAGAMGLHSPARDLTVSPQHRLLIEGPWAEMLFGDPEVLVAAAHLVGRPGVDQPVVRGVTYIHLMLDRHEVLLSDGLWTESFQPAARMVDAMDRDRAAEILALFPDLPRSQTAFPAARITLKAHEARVLLAA